MSTPLERAERHPFGPADDTCHGRCTPELRDWFVFESRGLLVPEEAHELLDMLLNRLAEAGDPR